MSGWGNPIARFYGPTNLSSPVDVSGTTHTALSCGGTENVFSSGEGWATFVYEAKFDTLAARGNVVWITQVSDVRGGAFTVIQPFTVTDTEYDANADLITVRGPFLADELRRYMIARPLGHETTINTSLRVAAPGPVIGREMDVGSPAGNDTFKVTSTSAGDKGKEFRVEMEDDTWFVSEVIEIRDFEGAKYIITRDRNPVDAGAGRPVELRTLEISLDDMDGVAAGQEITITMDSGSHATLIDRIIPGEHGGKVVLRDGMTGSAASGKAVVIKDYSQKSTSDVTKVMAFATGWSVAFSAGGATGTARGTRYPGGGETVQNILKSIAAETGEFYRLRSADYGTPGPKREIIWRRTSDAAGDGANLKLVQGSTSDIATAQANKNRGIILSPPEYKRVFDPITAIFPVAGDARVTLFSCSDTAITDATTAGFTVKTTGLGLYAPPYIEDTALTSSIGLYQRTVTFSEVIVEGDSVGSIRAAADRLMYLAIRYMRERANATEQLSVRCVTAMEIRPGQTVDVEYDAPTGSYSIDDTFYVQSVRREVGPDSQGVPITTVTLTPTYLAVPTESREIGRRLAAVDRAITRIGSPSQIRLSIPGGSGNTPPVSPPPPPVVGSDHDPVTAADTSVTVTGQAIKVNPASSGGLEVSSGLKVKADAGKAIELGASGVGVTLATNGGLKMDSGISLKFPANAGIKLDGTGAYLDPDTLTYATTNTVTGSKHTHAITAIDSSVGGETGLLKTTDGKLAVKYLGAGVAADTSTAIYGVASATGHTTLFLKQIAGQTGDIWRVENSSGTPYVRITGPGHLESGNPGFVSGQTGWRIWNTGNAEFNDLRVRGELHASVFVADEMHAVGGTLLVKTASRVGAPVNNGDNKLGAIDATFKLRAELSWDAGLNYFPKDTVLRIKPMGEIPAGGSLDLYDIYLQVTNVGSTNGRDLSKGNPGTVELTCKRRLGGATNFVIPTGSAVILWTRLKTV